MKNPIIVSVLNHKGGVLKTTVTANLGAALALMGKRVLLIDLDFQQNLTMGLIGTLEPEEGVLSLYDAFIDQTGFDHLIRHTSTPNLDIIPVTEDFVATDLSLVSVTGRELVLKSCLRKTERLHEYDLVILDNPPALSLVVTNALAASDYFLVPCLAEYYPTRGLKLLGNSIEKLGIFTQHLRSLGVIVTGFNLTESIHRTTDKSLREELPGSVFETRIRVNSKGKVAISRIKTIFQHERRAKGRGTEDFTKLGREFLQRLELMESAEAQQVVNG